MAQIMTQDEFDKFVDSIYGKLLRSTRYGFFRHDEKMIVYNTYTHECGMARCHDEDEFDMKYGLALAYCRMEGIEFPKVKTVQRVSIGTLNSGDVFYVHGRIYTFLAKHPKDDFYYALHEKTDSITKYASATVVSILKVE